MVGLTKKVLGGAALASLLSFSTNYSLAQNDEENAWTSEENERVFGYDFSKSVDMDGDGNYEKISAVLYAEKNSQKYDLASITFSDRNNDGVYEGAIIQNMPRVYSEDDVFVGVKSLTSTEAFRFKERDGEEVLSGYMHKEEAFRDGKLVPSEGGKHENLENKDLYDVLDSSLVKKVNALKEIPEDFNSGGRNKICGLLWGDMVKHGFKED